MGSSDKGAEGGKKFILVVNPDRETNDVICDVLDRAGCETMAVGQGGVGLEIIRKQRPDLVLINFTLPDMSGIDLCREIGGDEEIRGIPIIVISERNDPSEKVLAFEFGARRFISKPFSGDQLISEVRKTLDQLERTKDIKDYKESCGEGGDFGVFPTDLKKQAEECKREKDEE